MSSLRKTWLVLSVLGMLPETVARAGTIVAGQDTGLRSLSNPWNCSPRNPVQPRILSVYRPIDGYGIVVLERDR